jgi:hypothetical protein
MDWEEPLARAGLVAKGVLYGLLGLVALKLALGGGGASTSQGALEALAGTTYGTVLLVLLALGFAAYALWRFVQTAQTDKWGERIVLVARGVAYAAWTFTTVQILISGRQQSQNGKAHKATAVILGWPGGTVFVGIVGAVFVGVGLWQLYTGVSGRFEEAWHGHSRLGHWTGVVGHCARFVVFALIGVFAIKAAAEYDPKTTVGLDGALRKLAHAPYGPYLLGLTAAGLVAFGVFCFVDARYRDVTQ